MTSEFTSNCLPFQRKTKDDDIHPDDLLYDPLLWSLDLENHFLGEYSSAEVQPSKHSSRYSQVATLRNATFVGVYVRHRTPELSSYIVRRLWDHVRDSTTETISEDVIERIIAPDGSYCLVALIWEQKLYVANLGDSRVVLGYSTIGSNNITTAQLNRDDNVEVTREIVSIQRPDSTIDAQPNFHLSAPIKSPVLTAKPSIYKRVLLPTDDFLIFASHGLWEFLTNEDAVYIVHNNPRMGIAKRLVEIALQKAARKKDIRYRDLKEVKGKEASITMISLLSSFFYITIYLKYLYMGVLTLLCHLNSSVCERESLLPLHLHFSRGSHSSDAI